MHVGFIGAGKVGFSLGKYVVSRGFSVSGYYSKQQTSAEQAAQFTGSRPFHRLEDITEASDILFLTTPDGVIGQVWEQLRKQPLNGKCICHCSGSLSSSVFSGIEETGGFGYSVHPLQAICDKETSYQALEQAVFTLEGSPERLRKMKTFLEGLGNFVQVISTGQKSRYHCAAVMVSNHVIALVQSGLSMLEQCGFSQEAAQRALFPLVKANLENLLEKGPQEALTGPVERGDTGTVKAHLSILDREDATLYRALASRLIPLAKGRHPGWDDTDMRKVMEDAK